MKIDKKKTYQVEDYSFVNFINLDDDTVDKIRVWRNHPDIRKVMYDTEEIPQEQHRGFISNLSESDTKFYWLVLKDGNPVGVMSVVDVDYGESNGQLGYYLLPQYLGSGIGLEFISTVIYFIFSELGFYALFGRTELSNKDALRFNYHLGFRIRPDVAEIDGVKYVEQDCLAGEYLSRYKCLTSSKELAKSMKEFNKIYNTQLLSKR